MSAHGSALSSAGLAWGGCTGLVGGLVAAYGISPFFQPCKTIRTLPGVDPSPFDFRAELPPQCDWPLAAELGGAPPVGIGVFFGAIAFVLAYVVTFIYESATAPPRP